MRTFALALTLAAVALLGGASAVRADTACVASTLSISNVTVTSATLVPASIVTLPAGTFSVPEHCQIIGAVATSGECPTTGPWATGCGPGSAEFRLICRRSGTTNSCLRAAAEVAGRSPRPRSTP